MHSCIRFYYTCRK